METFEPTLYMLIFLCLAAVFAGFMDTLVGGGGLITIPALMMVGVPPIFALGTNKLQAVCGSGTAAFMMLKHRRVRLSDVRNLMVMAFIGAVMGAVLVQHLDTQLLELLIPICVLAIAIYFAFGSNQALTTRRPRLSPSVYALTAVPAIGFYDGMLGPGTGSFLAGAGVGLRGQQIVAATATAKTLNFATNLGSLVVFLAYAKVLWLAGGAMIIGQVIGANLGAHTLFRINPNILRYLVIGVCLIMLVGWYFKR